MILPAQAIRELCKNDLLVHPWHEREIYHGMTYGIGPCGYDIRIAEEHWLYPNEFKLASSFERFKIPLDVMGVVHDKSTWARRGVCVQNTVLEPGWEGYLTLELTNHSRDRIRILTWCPIAQVVFHKLTEATNTPYVGKYQSAPAGAQEAILEPSNND